MDNQGRQPPPSTIAPLAPGRLVEALRRQIAAVEGARRQMRADADGPVSSGCGALDRLLPGPGFRRGTLAEWIAADSAGGAATLAFCTARQACDQGGALVVLDSQREFYPPAAVRLGIEPQNLVVVQCCREAEAAWALDQALRSAAVAAVVAWPAALEGHAFRRLQLAAEEGGSLGLLIRPPAARSELSWADVRLWVEPLPAAACGPRRVKIEVLRSRGTAAGGSVQVEIDDETGIVHLDSPLADPAAGGRAAGA